MTETIEREEAPLWVWERDYSTDVEDELAVAVAEHVPQVQDGRAEIDAVAVVDRLGKVALKFNDPTLTVWQCCGDCARNSLAAMADAGLTGVRFIKASKNPAGLIAHALEPAEIERVEVTPSGAVAYVRNAAEAAKAIGRGGVNVRCASRLTGYRISVVEI